MSILNKITSLEQQLLSITNQLKTLKLQVKGDTPKPKGLLNRLHLFDFETTGLGKTKHIRICELGVVKYSNHQTKLQHYVNPTVGVSSSAQKVHGLKREFLETFNTWEKVGKKLNGYVLSEGTVLLGGFNSKRYDSRILFFEHLRHGLELPNRLSFIDFRDVFKEIFPNVTTPKTLNAYYHNVTGEDIPDAHTAVGDCLAIAKILESVTDTTTLEQSMIKHKESVSSLTKRCLK